MTSISVLGLGYVGSVSAACLAEAGNRVIGVDISPAKVNQINQGLSTIVEEGIGELISRVVQAGLLTATTDITSAILDSDLSLVCVGTPSRLNGSIDLGHILRIAQQIGEALQKGRRPHSIVIRSTVMPGTIEKQVIPAIEAASGLRHGEDFVTCSNPEFLREGTSIRDFKDPPFTLVGAMKEQHADALLGIYAHINAPSYVVPLRVAEMVKYTSNSFHALKVGFANEIGTLCKALQIDSHEVMKLFCEDKRLNISSAYLRPGFAFGGSCLPKDLRALVHRGRLEDVALPILEGVLESNRRQVERAFQMVLAAGSKQVGVLGLTFKTGTDDLRESPNVSLVEMLIGKGCRVVIHDRLVTTSNIIGANREYVEREIPHLWSLMRDTAEEVIEASETIVIGNNSPDYRNLGPALGGKKILDLVRAIPARTSDGTYEGIGW